MGLKRFVIEWAEGAVRRSRGEPSQNMYLTGNFAPVAEEGIDTELKSTGEIPAALNGAFIRNGPNPQFRPLGGYHWFDGDGMLHSLRLKDGKAIAYSNHWVKTNRLDTEKKAGKAVFMKIGDLEGKGALVMAILGNMKRQFLGTSSTGNTALEFHAGRILALEESNAPWAVRLLCDGALETMGSLTFGGKLRHPVTAHPKVCPSTGNLVMFGYQADKSQLDFSVANPKGEIVRTEKIQYRFPQMVHDFAITDNYAVFMDLCLIFDPKVMVKEEKLPFVYDKQKGARFGIIKRGELDSEPIKWFEAKGCYIFHTVNAWEEPGASNKVHLLACRTEEFDLNLGTLNKKPDGSYDFSNWKGGESTLYEYIFDLDTGDCKERVVTPLPSGLTGMDFPRIHPALTGKPIKFCYCAALTGPVTTGVIKVEVSTGKITGRIIFPVGSFGSGDPVFVPSKGAQSTWSAVGRGASAVEGAEDDGYLMTFVNDEKAGNTSELWIMDGKTMKNDPVARVVVPRRIPYGFHGTWVSESDIKQQKTEPLKRLSNGSRGGFSFVRFSLIALTTVLVVRHRRRTSSTKVQ